MAEPLAKKAKFGEATEKDELAFDKNNVSSFGIAAEKATTEVPVTKQFRGAVEEKDVGITEYIGECKGFTGILKQRFSDFLVNEIDIKGKIVRLTDISNPATPPEETMVAVSEESTLTEEWKLQLLKLQDEKDPAGKVEMLVGDDKQVRSKIHQAIREQYTGLDSSTGQKDGQKCITVAYKPHRSKEDRNRDRWPRNRGDYCHVIMYKENKDTMDAIGVIAKMLRLKPSLFTFAGTKDKRGKTCQQVAIYKVPAPRLHQLNKGLRGMALGNFSYCKQPLKLGELNGNHFVIILRSLTGEIEDINSSMESLRNKGFINYYGLQRFGTTSVPTHHVGKALLQGRWSDAIDLILLPRPGDSDEVTEGRRLWAELKEPKLALAKIQRPGIERTLLTGLVKTDKTDFVGALSELPRNTRLMYVHAYQSYLWNLVASRRIKEFGFKVMEGDLVLPPSAARVSSSQKEPVTVTAETLENYTLYDIVMPLPGWDVKFPANGTGDWYHTLLEEDGLSKADLKNKVKDYSLPGDYRHLVVKPGTVEWSVLRYDDVTQSLVLSDFEKLKGETLAKSEGSNRALRLEMSLSSSTYATMALREVLRAETSAFHQASLNQQ